MSFNTIKINKKRTRKYTKRNNNKKFQTIIINSSIAFLGICLLFLLFIYVKFISGLPDIEKLEELDIKKSSIIYDRDGNQLYTLSGDEKRTYVNYDDISQNMINAIVAGEDNTFFENSGIDYFGILRAVVNRIIGKTDDIQGTSTISQQLIKNVFLTNEKTYERKIKEAYLSFQMNVKYSKEKILELYLNKIGFGSNAYGVQQASLTFFGKKISDVNVIEASILASLPKGPTYYSPYNYPYRLLGYVYAYHPDDTSNITKIYSEEDYKTSSDKVKLIYDIVKEYRGMKLGENGLYLCGLDPDDYKDTLDKSRIDEDGCIATKASEMETILNSIQVTQNGYKIEYQTGRKDYILGRMLDDGYITFDEYKTAFLKGFGFKFNEYIEKIKYPHFVMYIKEYLSEKYGEDLIQSGGLKIYTTLDSNLQDKAEEIVENQTAINETKFGANNAALISLDNKTGDILAYVGGADYFDSSIDGNVNMLNSQRQPGSTFKSFVYALAIDKNKIGSNSPVYDLDTVFPGDYEPKNYDGEFLGRMSLRTALNYSRNIPAVKAYFLAGEQTEIVDYMKSCGVESLSKDFYYGAPLALGSGEMTPLELAQAYSVFANMGSKVEVNPILKILDSNGLVIEEKKTTAGVQVLNESTAYIINNMLSDSSSRPTSYWNNALSIDDGRVAAAKTGTSNKLFVKNGNKEYYPGDLWTAGYTPQITTIVWAGNTNGKEINKNGSGLEGASPMWKEFMDYAHQDLEKETWEKPSSVKTATISKLSGLLAPSGYDTSFAVSSLFTNKPTGYDNSLQYIEVDQLCNGKVTSSTPKAAIKSGYYIELRDIDPTRESWQESIQERLKEGGGKQEFGNIPNIITYYQDAECIRSSTLVKNADITVSTDIDEDSLFLNGENKISVSYKSNNPLRRIEFLLGDNIISTVSVDNEKIGTYNGTFEIPSGYDGDYKLTIRVVDTIYYSEEKTYDIEIKQDDDIPPVITISNPNLGSIYEDQFKNLRFSVFDHSTLRSINIYVDGKPYKLGLKGNDQVVEINKEGNISVGGHTITIEAVDFSFNKSQESIDIEILGR